MDKPSAKRPAHQGRRGWDRLHEGLEWITALAQQAGARDDLAIQEVRKFCCAALIVVRRERRAYRKRSKRRVRWRGEIRESQTWKSAYGDSQQLSCSTSANDAKALSKPAQFKRRIDCVRDTQYLKWVGSEFDELLNTLRPYGELCTG